MAHCRTLVTTSSVCIFFIVPAVVFSMAITHISVPYDAPTGYKISTIETNGETVRLKHVDTATKLFSLSEEGLLTVRRPLQNLLRGGRTGVMIVVQHGRGPMEWEELLNVHVTGANNKLHFSAESHVGHVPENSPVGTIVTGVEDLSVWRGDTQVLQVELSGEGNDLFSVEVSSQNGRIELYTEEILDREGVSAYHLRLTIVGDGQNPETAETEIHVVVEDVNDNRPQFYELENHFSIALSSPVGTEAASVFASDRDAGENGRVTYSVITESANLAIDQRTGVIYVKEPVREPRTLQLYVLAHDMGRPSLSSPIPAHVAVIVRPVTPDFVPYGNDILYPPDGMMDFQHGRYRRADLDPLILEVAEHTPLGTVIGNATDVPVETDRYETDSPFVSVDLLTGRIRLQVELNFEERTLYDGITITIMNSSDTESINTRLVSLSVVDDSDPPFWTMAISPYIAVVPTDAPRNAAIYRLSAEDEDANADIRFYLRSGDSFTVDERTGDIITKAGTVYSDENEPYTLSVYAEDVNSVSEDGDLRIVNGVVTVFVGSYPPQFTSDPYEVNVLEHGGNSQSVVTVEALSFDRQEVMYTLGYIPPGTPPHTIDLNSGALTLRETIDREVLDSYYVVVTATETGGDFLSSEVRVNVKVTDNNDNTPKFQQAAYTFDDVAEDIGTEVLIGSVQAVDPDEGSNGQVYYSLTGEDASYFRVDENGDLFPGDQLDYDLRSPTYYFTLTASDGGSPNRSSVASVRVRVTARSDETPVFKPTRYTYYVDETAREDYSIGTVYASDADGDIITFSLMDGSNDLFAIEPETGVIKLNSNPDRKLPDAEYSIRVVATDPSGLSSVAEVTIVVNDVNDNAPVFTNCSSYSPHVLDEQEVTPGSEPFVIQVVATDDDRGANAEITYRLLWDGTGDNPFIINSETGVISLTFGPDREFIPSYKVTAIARDRARDPSIGLCTFIITVDDVNDSRPRFRRNEYQAIIPATAEMYDEVVTVQAEDPDENSTIIYTFANDQNPPYFKIHPNTGIITVQLPLTILADQTWTATIKASDGIHDAFESLIIKVVDSRDPAPVFRNFPAVFVIPENFSTSQGSNVLAQFQADSSGSDLRISYKLLRGARPETNFPVRFTLNVGEDFLTATIIVSGALDYETVQQMELTIVANGLVGSIPGYATVNIQLEDVNDNAPHFPLVDFDATVKEHSPVGTSVARVVAEDGDSGAEFREMVYSIDNSGANPDWENFEIDSATGEITTTAEFDREQVKTYLINVIARNTLPLALGTNLPNRAQTSVRIDILDINDNQPQFAEESYMATVAENMPVGTLVTTVTATDLDNDSTLRYLITNGNTNGVFEVDPDSGEISIAVGLDFEKVQSYVLEYSANDGLNSALTTVNINVMDVNDKRPEFDQLLYTASVLEENADNIPRVIVQVNAVDGDSTASPVRYSLEGTGAGNLFTINPGNGEITLLGSLDREQQAVYNLVAIAQDQNGQGLTGYASVVVTVEDINDWAPTFPDVEYVGSVPEGSPSGTKVMEVVAEDKDDPNTANGRLSYNIVPTSDRNDGSDLFSIDTSTGTVRTKVSGDRLDREVQDTYILKVTATDGTSTAETTATVIIEDVNDNRPIFVPTEYSANVPETLGLGETAVEVTVMDVDTAFHHEMTFEIIAGNTDGAFDIYTDTPTLHGLIYPVKVLDFETPPTTYDLQVRINDGAFSAMARVLIVLVDENEPPVFNPMTYMATISEDLLPSVRILNVTATDPDLNAANNRISYSVDPASDPDALFIMVVDELQVAPGKALDRETTDNHQLTILATDSGIPPLFGSAAVSITLLDVDDTAPRFAEDYVAYVNENTTALQWVAVVSAVDDDLIPSNPIFTYFIQESQPGVKYFRGRENMDNNSFTIWTLSTPIDREEHPTFDFVIDISDQGGNTGPNILEIVVLDQNDNPHHPVVKNMLVYAFEGSYPDPGAVPNLGIGYVGVNDADILEDKTYEVLRGKSEYVSVDTDTGLVTIVEGTPSTVNGEPYTLDIKVSDGGRYPDITSTIVINVKEIPKEAVFKSGSLRLSGVTPEEFISPRGAVSSGSDSLKNVLSAITGAEQDNIDIFTILPVPGEENMIDVRYSAHGSPYYSAERLNSYAENNKQKIESLGVVVEAIYIDECSSATCESDCSNVLVINPTPVVINAVDASLVAINSRIEAQCGCAAREGVIDTCANFYCHNGGTCEDTASGPQCRCPEGFQGPACQKTTRSFKKGYAWFPSLKQCSQTRTSLEFVTTQSSGVLLYNGPTSRNGPQDYILLTLRAGKPSLSLDLGSGSLTLEVAGSPTLDDGMWHKVDIFRDGLFVEMVIDDCSTAMVTESHVNSVAVTDTCLINGTLQGDDTDFNVNQPLQLGGVKPGLSYPTGVALTTGEGFVGCIRNVDQDSTLYDLFDTDDRQYSDPGCPEADDWCDRLTPRCINGFCDADFFGAVCICNPGWSGLGCADELPAYDFLDNSYVEYQLLPNLPLPGRESNYRISFRTRKQSGLIWQITNTNTFEHVTMKLVGGKFVTSWHLGDGTVSVTLDRYPVANGEWHNVAFDRHDNYVRIRVDGGGGVRQAESRESTFRELVVDRSKLLVGAELSYGVKIVGDFVGCMRDPRIGNNYLGVTTDTDWAEPIATNVNEGCPTDACMGNDMCPDPFVCVDIWRLYECRCPSGFVQRNNTCIDVVDCASSPCQNGGTCIEGLNGQYKCECTKGYIGDNCNSEAIPVVLTIGTSGILPILACLLLLLILLLSFIVYKRNVDKKQALAFAIDPEDDIRENFINYDEEGGEQDQTAFDVSTLRIPVRLSPTPAPKPRPIEPEPVPQRSIPRDNVNVGDFLKERLGEADIDDVAPPYDTLHTYDYEGDGSTAGSLSSLNSTSSSDASQDYDYLNDLGPPFKRLADMYGRGDDN